LIFALVSSADTTRLVEHPGVPLTASLRRKMLRLRLDNVSYDNVLTFAILIRMIH
jgi:hypothetical protein